MLSDVTTTLKDIQEEFIQMVYKETILVGHSLENDLAALKIFHDLVIDTAVMYKHPCGRSYKTALRVLAHKFLNRQIQSSGNGHDSVEDAKGALELALLKIRHEETGNMGVTVTVDGNTSPIIPSRFYKGVVDNDSFMSKIMPHVVKGAELIQGKGEAGSIKVVTFAEGTNLKPAKFLIDEVNEDAFLYSYTLIEGSELGEKIEKISFQVKFESAPDGGSIYKLTSTYYTKDEIALSEAELKAGKEGILALYKAVEGHLLQNPDAYA